MPSRNPVSAISAMRPSIMTLVSRICSSFSLLLSAKDPAQRREIEHIALVGSNHETHISHEQHYYNLQKTLGWTGRDAVSNHQGEKIRAKNAEDAANRGPYEPCKAGKAESPFKNYDKAPITPQCQHRSERIARKAEQDSK